ncbi:MAG: hypothetical protein R3A12_17095 [Ignavibacteria bacterium]|nr:hypothetical protein [Ignavibacteriota bacterium]
MNGKTIVFPVEGGFLGKRVANFFKEKGFKIVILTRGKAKIENVMEYINRKELYSQKVKRRRI